MRELESRIQEAEARIKYLNNHKNREIHEKGRD